jgi:tetratricopeptide (TPR) repeat protein
MSKLIEVKGFFKIILDVNKELYEYDKHPSTMSWIGRCYSELCNYDKAREWYEKCLDAANQDPTETALALNGLASINIAKGDYDGAEKNLNDALKVLQDTCNEEGASIWFHLAVIDLNRNKLQEAKEKFERSLDIRQKTGKISRIPHCLYQLAIINNLQGNEKVGKKLLKDALDISLQIGDPHIEAAIYFEISHLELEQKNFKAAYSLLGKALKITQQISDIYGEAAIWHQLGVLLKNQGRLNDSIKFLAISHYLSAKIGHEKREHSQRSLLKAGSLLGYSQSQVDALQREVTDLYQKDGGRSLIEATFESWMGN